MIKIIKENTVCQSPFTRPVMWYYVLSDEDESYNGRFASEKAAVTYGYAVLKATKEPFDRTIKER
jgi:hypothetical protein